MELISIIFQGVITLAVCIIVIFTGLYILTGILRDGRVQHILTQSKLHREREDEFLRQKDD